MHWSVTVLTFFTYFLILEIQMKKHQKKLITKIFPISYEQATKHTISRRKPRPLVSNLKAGRITIIGVG